MEEHEANKEVDSCTELQGNPDVPQVCTTRWGLRYPPIQWGLLPVVQRYRKAMSLHAALFRLLNFFMKVFNTMGKNVSYFFLFPLLPA